MHPTGADLPIFYELDRDSRLIRTRCVGNATYAEVIEHFRELESLAPLPPRLNVLLDLTAMESLPDGAQMRGVASAVDGLTDAAKWGAWAVVTDRDALFGMIRMLHVFVEQHVQDFGVFRRLEEAERWLERVHRPAE